MRKQYVLILVFIISCLSYVQIYSINYLHGESFLQSLGDDWDELELQGLHQSSRPKLARSFIVTTSPIKAYKNSSYVKFELGTALTQDIDIQIIDEKGSVIYSQQYTPTTSTILISIGEWNKGDYIINVKDTSGSTIVTGNFEIR
ncbi:DUF3244 domain-containing protein [Dysgonomonas sp. Marseille-P4677]|uniref:DUF3244 domain-containing protein n=1 Tax=Dysgonomonas sp. Marseille-P4677 TaxID=2364790 RepID=UPI0019140EE6|nr:DUF3244 domain-containing protein [Dysgonomonas sp. Marseille-P4677]MBK5721358.1 DUF3244 domain-containing protein [Dysgonomonas sp. Marseille-P4677]